MTIDNMIDNVCRKYGFEVYETISFCKLCESGAAYETIKSVYNTLME